MFSLDDTNVKGPFFRKQLSFMLTTFIDITTIRDKGRMEEKVYNTEDVSPFHLEPVSNGLFFLSKLIETFS